MDSTCLLGLASHFNDKLSVLKMICELRQTGDDDTCKKYLCHIERELENLELTMTLLRQEVRKQKQQYKSVQELKSNFDRLIKDINYASNNLPLRLPCNNTADNQASENDKAKKENQNDTVKAEIVKEVKKKTKKHCPTIEYLTVDEFEQVPKYMKGRITYSQVNSVVEELNKTFICKYKIVHMKRTTMNDSSRKRYETYKSQENKDTHDVFFIVETDIKDMSSVKMDAVTRTILTILRHCGRIREIRGGKITRFAIIESY